MIVEMSSEGKLTIRTETEFEFYAMSEWVNNNLSEDVKLPSNLFINLKVDLNNRELREQNNDC